MRLSDLSPRNRAIVRAREARPKLPEGFGDTLSPPLRRFDAIRATPVPAATAPQSTGSVSQHAILELLRACARTGRHAPYRHEIAAHFDAPLKGVQSAWTRLHHQGAFKCLNGPVRPGGNTREYVVRLATGEILRTPGMPTDVWPMSLS